MTAAKPKLMVIDDLDNARAMLRRTLARSCEVYDFASVAEALPALERAEFDAIVTDLRMPGLDALEVLRRMRAEGISVPVVLLTAFSDEQVRRAARSLGACAVLDKPIDLDDLEVEVGRLLSGGDQAPAG